MSNVIKTSSDAYINITLLGGERKFADTHTSCDSFGRKKIFRRAKETFPPPERKLSVGRKNHKNPALQEGLSEKIRI